MEPQAAALDARPSQRAHKRPIPETGAKALVLFNAKAGSVAAGDEEKLVEALKAAGIEQVALFGPEKISRRLLERARKFDVLIVLGGDGTARALAELAPRDGPPLVLLPGGTLNILPRALYGERAWPEALAAALERGVIKRLTAGRANGHAFYVAALFGAPTLLARAREAVREGKPLAAWRRFRHFMGRSFARSLRARPNRDPAKKAEAIGVLCPSFSGGIEADSLEWVRLDAKHLLDLARVGLRALTRGWRDDPVIEISKCRTGDIISLGVIPATLDGEPHTFLSRVRITYDKRGPRVIALEQEES
ncbi:MAG: diacylglycerol kinase family protein [Hyphomonadaceae bacterium]